MKISVALCTYNGEAYLASQLDSIMRQTVSVQEVIITDDDSKDSTAAIVKKFQEQYPNIIHFDINKPNLGAKKNFEKALSLCIGDVIFLSDQDDVWRLNKVEKIIAYLEKYPHLEAVFTDASLINDRGEETGGSLFNTYHFQAKHQSAWEKGDALFDMLSGMNRVTGATMAIRKSLLTRALPFNLPKLAWHDAWLSIHAALENKLGWINEPLTLYRVHAGQQIGVGNGTTVTSYNKFESLKELLEQVRHHESEWLKVTDMLLASYPSTALIKFRKRKLKLLRLINFRLSVPIHPALRIVKVLTHFPLYFNTLGKPVRSVVRDILKPPH